MNQQRVYVGFEEYQVAVDSNAPEVLAGLERCFRKMFRPEPTRTVGRLEVQKNGEKYHLLGNGETSLESRCLANIVKHLTDEVVLHLIQARPDFLWFHAGAAAYGGSAVVVCGPWGQGKSTLVTSLCARGWMYLSDDVVPLDPSSGKVIPFPQTPMVRENLGREVPRDRLAGLRKAEMDLKPEIVCREAMPIGILLFPNYSLQSATKLTPCSAATATVELLQNCLNFVGHRGAAVRYLCDLMSRTRAFRLSFNNGKLAAELIAQVL